MRTLVCDFCKQTVPKVTEIQAACRLPGFNDICDKCQKKIDPLVAQVLKEHQEEAAAAVRKALATYVERQA